MEPSRPALRLFLLSLLVALPPLAAFAVVAVLAHRWLDRLGAGTALLIAVLLTGLWAGAVSIIAGRGLLRDVYDIVALAERGRQPGAPDGGRAEAEGRTALERLAAALAERNRQIAELAAHVRQMPIQGDATTVAGRVVAAAHSVTHDPTWTLAILRSPAPDALPPGVYGPESAPDTQLPAAIEEVHRWASTIGQVAEAAVGAQVAAGPWGAFAVVEVAAGDELRAILLAPWEGRPDPSLADLELLRLLGQQSATAIEHALLYWRLRAQADDLQRMSAVQTDFLRGVTHDLRTPLTSISALALELRDSPDFAESARADLDMIAHQADRLRRMVGQLLAVSRLEAGALQPRVEVFRPEPILRRTWEAIRAPDRSFAVTQDGPPHLVVADPDRLEQVFWAVLDNAVKYSTTGSAIEVSLGSRTTGGGELIAEIVIRDHGVGMPPDAAQQAFDQFYRGDTARSMVPDGSGVGLHAARGLVRAMGGELTLLSELGSGTTVTLTLPAETAEEPAEPAARASL
jgi:signal transduction histidine kinase